ncbi:MAG TPA: PIN domain-containing protein [Burkholderiales bacterium]|nr:PIN domain-containing protein [Burkholderiales bacterium]
MELKDLADGERVYLDANVFIYAFEGFPAFLPVLTALFARMDRGELSAVTSELTLAEVLVKPLQDGNDFLRQRYEETLKSSSALAVIPVSRAVLSRAAWLRARHETLKMPDAIHLATALAAGCNRFLTNDYCLAALPGIAVAMLSDLAVPSAPNTDRPA